MAGKGQAPFRSTWLWPPRTRLRRADAMFHQNINFDDPNSDESTLWNTWFFGSTSGVTGTLAVTEANDTLSSNTSVTVVGTLSTTEANDTLSSNVNIGSGVSATLSVTEDNDTLTSNVSVTVVGTLSVTEDNDTLSSNVTVTGSTTATLSVTEDNDILSSSGFVGSVTCTLTVTEGNDSLSSSCTVGSGQVGGRQREPIEWGWDWYNAPNPFKVSDVRTSAARLGQLGGIASGKARSK
jgi:hypothetical protein